MSACRRLVNSRAHRFTAIALAFCIGVGIAPIFLFVRSDVLLAAAIVLAAFGVVLSSRGARLMVLLSASLVFGMSVYSQALIPEGVATVQDHVGVAARVSGVIDGEVEKRMNGQRAVIDSVAVADEPVEGKVLVFFDQVTDLHYGDEVVFGCSLAAPEPIESFRYDQYLASKGIHALCYRPQYIDVQPMDRFSVIGGVLSMKERVVKQIGAIIPEPHAAFLSGLLFGGSSSLSGELQDDFSRTGTSHILAASGFNVSLFTLVFLRWILGTPLGRKKSLLLTAVLLAAYVVMAGGTPAVVRAAIMASVLLVGKLVRRKSSMENVFVLTAAIMLLFNPLILLWDVGFQLSFVAMLALVYVAPRWQSVFSFIPESFGLQESFVGSLAAIALTLPVVLWHFGSVSLIAPISNLLVLPLVPILMALAALALVISIASTSLGSVAAVPAWGISSLLLHLIRWFASLPFATVSPAHASLMAFASAFLLLFVLLRFRPAYA